MKGEKSLGVSVIKEDFVKKMGQQVNTEGGMGFEAKEVGCPFQFQKTSFC